MKRFFCCHFFKNDDILDLYKGHCPAAVSKSKLSKRLMSLDCNRKIGNNVPHFSDFFKFKNYDSYIL